MLNALRHRVTRFLNQRLLAFHSWRWDRLHDCILNTRRRQDAVAERIDAIEMKLFREDSWIAPKNQK